MPSHALMAVVHRPIDRLIHPLIHLLNPPLLLSHRCCLHFLFHSPAPSLFVLLPRSNLLFSADTRDVAIEAGALFTLQAGIISGNADASRHCLKALFSACKNVPLMPSIAKTSLPIALCTFAAGDG